jgi:flavin-dependent dehydrogenase
MVDTGRATHVVAQLDATPVLQETDVVVIGGSSAAVAAACAATDRGAQVMLIAPRPYLGDDLCGRQHLWLEEGEQPESELAKALFPLGRVTTPFTIKGALDKALLKAGVRCLTGSSATELLVDEQGQAAGVVIANRSGRQAIRAKVVIDASRHAAIARQTGADFRAFVPGEKDFHFVVVGGEPKTGTGLTGRTLDVTFKNPAKGKPATDHPVYAYTARAQLSDDSFAAFARAEQAVRDLVYGPGMQDCSEFAWYFPEDTIVGEARVEGRWPGVSNCDLGVFRPRNHLRLYVLSEYADLGLQAQTEMLRPLPLLATGERVGQAAADQASKTARVNNVRLAKQQTAGAVPVTFGTPRNVAPPPEKAGTVNLGERALPVLGRYDVVVVGGGTAGAPAGIGAARSSAKTLVIEYLDELGGVGTAGLIGSYWYGVRGGFTKEIDEALGGKNRWPDGKRGDWNVVQKSDWLRRELLKAKADVWFNSFGCGAVMEKDKVTGVMVATPFGLGVVLAKTVVDSTGNADIADSAGAETQFGVAPGGMLSVQLAGFPGRNLGDNLNNTCFALIDDTSAVDIWHLMAWSRAELSKNNPYDVGQLLDSRERRRIVADYMLTTPDILNHRSFPDTISQHKSNFDAAAFPTSLMLLIKDMKGPAFEVDLPYRSLLPRGIDGILVTGLGAGAERDAMTLVRMQPDLQNQGYAAGTAAAMAAANGGHTRQIDIKSLQTQMVEKGVLAPRVLTDRDSHPMSQEALEKAVADVGNMVREIKQSRTVEDPSIFSLAAIMAHPEPCLPLLKKAYAEAAEDRKLIYARILGVIGDLTGAPTLIAAVEGAPAWDKGFGLTAHRESDNTFSDLDRQVIALGLSGAPAGLAPILGKLKLLTPDSELSHYIAVALALNRHKQPKGAVEPLVRLLNEPGFPGRALIDPVDRLEGKWAERDFATNKPDTNLNKAFRELLIAGMLVYCGDSQGQGRKILEQYSKGVEGHFARYARHVLQTADGSGK